MNVFVQSALGLWMLFGGSVQRVDTPSSLEIASGVWCNTVGDVQAVFQDRLDKQKEYPEVLKARNGSCMVASVAMNPGKQVGIFVAAGMTFGVFEISVYGIYDESSNAWKDMPTPSHVFGAHPIASPTGIES